MNLLQNDPDKASNMPKDGTVHELTNHVCTLLFCCNYYYDNMWQFNILYLLRTLLDFILNLPVWISERR